MDRNAPISAALASLLLAGCVTINIYFPAAAAERAADRIIDEIWQIKPDVETPQGSKPSQPSR
jgi:hypothetical protein